MKLDIKNINKAKILAALYNNSRPLGLGFIVSDNDVMTQGEAQELLNSGQTYFDYLKGRVMKIDLSTDELRTELYDRDNGNGACEYAIKRI